MVFRKKNPISQNAPSRVPGRRRFLTAAAGGTMMAVLQPSILLGAQNTSHPLPPPSTGDQTSLMTALQHRKSTRNFSSRPIPDQVMSNLLWAAFGVNRPDTGYRTAPSPMNVQEMDVYAATEKGLFFYDPWFHQLVRLSAKDIRKHCGKQGFVAAAPLNLIYVANFSKLGKKDENKNYFYAAADAGCICQNVYLFCAAFGLGTVVRDWINRPKLDREMTLEDNQRIILSQTVGYPEEKGVQI